MSEPTLEDRLEDLRRAVSELANIVHDSALESKWGARAAFDGIQRRAESLCKRLAR